MKWSKGAILVEFAIGFPIIIMMLYGFLDAHRAYSISSELHIISEMYSQMMVNAAKQKYKKEITIEDLKGISKIIGIALYGVHNDERYPFYLSTYVTCIKGTSNNAFSVLWSVHIKNDLNKGIVESYDDDKYASIGYSSTSFSKNIQELSIHKDEVKILIESIVWYDDASSRGFNSKFYLFSFSPKSRSSANVFDGNIVAIPTDALNNVTSRPL